MKLIKKVIYVVLIAIIAIFAYSLRAQAATVKVTEDLLNLRKEASTSSKVLTILSEGTECEFIEKDGDWYKVKYKTYTGYVASKYTKLIEDADNTTTSEDSNSNKEDDSTDTKVEDNEKIVIGKLSKDTATKILPLINSSVIGNLKKGTEVTIITETTGWSYISTDEISAWIRSDSITERKNENAEKVEENNTTTSQEENATKKDENPNENVVEFKEKVMYTNDSFINVREKPSTSSKVLMVLALNTKLTVIGEEGDWYKVKTSVGNAYVSKELLSEQKVQTTSRGTTIDRGTTTDKTEETTTTKTENTTTSSASTTKGEEIVAYAKKFLGVPYVYGGASAKGFDCSGFTMYVYKKFGISMSHGAQAQSKRGTAVKADKKSASSLKQNLKAGDLVFFLDYETMDEIGHCGIYIGNGEFIHASSGTGYCVKIDSLLPGNYYNTRYCAARRII